MTVVLPPTPTSIARASAALHGGELVAIPTETVYGLAGSAVDERAVASIFQAKARPTFDPIIVHIAEPEGWSSADDDAVWRILESPGLVDATSLGADRRGIAARLARAFWPGPLTLVLPRGPRVPDLVTSGLSTVAVRMPAHPVAQAILAASALPLAAPSANRFGRISPTTASDVVAELDGRIPFVIDGGPCAVGIESTVVAVGSKDDLELLRPGGVPREAVAAVAGTGVRVVASAAASSGVPSPGMLESHYAPSKPFVLLATAVRTLSDRDEAAIRASLRGDVREVGLLVAADAPEEAVRRFERACGRSVIAVTLSRSGNSEEAARALFSALRSLDGSTAQLLFAEPWPESEGLGYAIADRLRRAAGART